MAGRDRGKRVVEGDGGRPSGRAARSGGRSGEPTDDSRLSPGTAISLMTEGELQAIRDQFAIPDEFVLRLPGVGGRADNPPEGWITVYEEYMRAGLRFPLNGFVRNLFKYYLLSPGQLVPNSIRVVVGFLILCNLLNIRARMGLFRPFFVLRRHTRMRGWWMFPTRSGSFFSQLPSSIHGWKNKYFYVSCPSGSWGFPTTWTEPRVSPNNNSSVDTADEADFRTLKGRGVCSIKDLLTDDLLFMADASSPGSGESPGRIPLQSVRMDRMGI